MGVTSMLYMFDQIFMLSGYTLGYCKLCSIAVLISSTRPDKISPSIPRTSKKSDRYTSINQHPNMDVCMTTITIV